jgi:hypothetical protein
LPLLQPQPLPAAAAAAAALCRATVASVLKSLIGCSTFWAVLSLSTLKLPPANKAVRQPHANAAAAAAAVCRATVASELESLIGYSTFWAVLSLSTLTGSLADAAFSKIPITQGPGPAVAAVAAALLAYHARNW